MNLNAAKSQMKPALIAALTGIWFACVAIGMKELMSHETESGPRRATQKINQADLLSVQNNSEKPYLLVMFAHPQCACTKASLAELQWLAARCSEKASVTAIFVKPEGASKDWLDSENWKLAKNLSGVATQADEGGEIAKKFGAMTSGHTFLIDREGNILFSGGITQARGVEGDNDGRRAIHAITMKGARIDAQAKPIETNVFGCLLY